jgi:hypothetical protein
VILTIHWQQQKHFLRQEKTFVALKVSENRKTIQPGLMLKTWKSLKQVFRHGRQKHYLVFQSAVVLTQIATENGIAPFQVTNYRDPAY